MKIIFSHLFPFSLTHGGVQTLIESLRSHLSAQGVAVEPERWWDENQRGDILHFFGRPHSGHVRMAKQKGYKIVLTDLLDKTASRSCSRLFIQHCMIRAAQRFLPQWTERIGWEVYRNVDALIFIVKHEWGVARFLFNAQCNIVRIIPHGLEEKALKELIRPQTEEDYLVSLATIDPRKNSVLLAQAASAAKLPVLFLGRPYSEQNDYFKQFRGLVDDRFVRYGGFVSEEEKCRLLRGARGFVLLSQFESGCFAVYEAAAAGLPMLLPKLPWACYYPENDGISFVRRLTVPQARSALTEFYRIAHRRPTSLFYVNSWDDIARQYLEVYQEVLRL